MVHLGKLFLDFGHMIFVWGYKLSLLGFEKSIDFVLKVVCEGVKLLDWLWDGFGVLLF